MGSNRHYICRWYTNHEYATHITVKIHCLSDYRLCDSGAWKWSIGTTDRVKLDVIWFHRRCIDKPQYLCRTEKIALLSKLNTNYFSILLWYDSNVRTFVLFLLLSVQNIDMKLYMILRVVVNKCIFMNKWSAPLL